MKIRTKLVIFAFVLALLLMLFSCSKNEGIISYGEDGSYTGFSDIPSDYTPADATDDGCLVIDLTQGTNEYGATINEKYDTAGYDNWQRFLKKSESQEDTFLRVAFFIDGVGSYHDLYYCDGNYTIFALNEYGVSDGSTYKYLRRLDGQTGPASDRQEDCFYVLTDSMDLTYNDVSWSFFSSNIDSVTDIPFVWLGFMIFFE